MGKLYRAPNYRVPAFGMFAAKTIPALCYCHHVVEDEAALSLSSHYFRVHTRMVSPAKCVWNYRKKEHPGTLET